jgi:nucleotide-binding universal stress UspA family protein
MDLQHNPSRAEPSRLLVAAEPSIDPHRLVRLCCEHAEDDLLSVSLLVPVPDKSQPWSRSSAAAERLLLKAAALLDGAGVRLEELIIADEDGQEIDQLLRFGGFDALLVGGAHGRVSAPALVLASRLARLKGMAVVGDGCRPGQSSFLRRVLDPLLHWPRPGERAT